MTKSLITEQPITDQPLWMGLDVVNAHADVLEFAMKQVQEIEMVYSWGDLRKMGVGWREGDRYVFHAPLPLLKWLQDQIMDSYGATKLNLIWNIDVMLMASTNVEKTVRAAISCGEYTEYLSSSFVAPYFYADLKRKVLQDLLRLADIFDAWNAHKKVVIAQSRHGRGRAMRYNMVRAKRIKTIPAITRNPLHFGQRPTETAT